MMKFLALLNVGAFGLVVAVALFALHGSLRLTVVGCLCAALTIAMYAAPLGAMVIIYLYFYIYLFNVEFFLYDEKYNL